MSSKLIDLPTEILLRITDYFTSWQDRNNFACVHNTVWQAVSRLYRSSETLVLTTTTINVLQLSCSRRIQLPQYQLPLDFLHTVIRSSYAAEEYIIPRPSSSNRKFARWLTHTMSAHHENAARIQFNVIEEDRDM
jgi:hypothetical protein